MAATLLARYSTTQRLSGSCSGQLRPAAGMAVLVVVVMTVVLMEVAVMVTVLSMVCPTAW